MADGDVLVLTGGHQSFSAISELASSLPRLRGFAVNAATTYTSGTVILSAGANITLGTNGQTITISGNAAAGAQTNQTLGLYGLSQTTGGASSTTLDARTLSINAYGALSVGFSAGSIQLSVPNVVAQSSVTFGNANGVSFGLNGSTVTGSVAAQTVQTQNVAVLSASNSVFTSGTVVLSGANGITVGTGAQTIYISGEGLMSSWFHNTAALYSQNFTLNIGTALSLMHIPIPHALSFTRVDVLVSIQTASSATANTAAYGFSSVAVLYSRNVSTLNPIVGALGSTTYSWASNSGAATDLTGPRNISFPLASTLSAGDYWLGVAMSTTSALSIGTATTALGMSMSMLHGTIGNNAANWTDIGQATGVSLNAVWPFMGLISSTVSATSQSLQLSQVTGTNNNLQRANLIVLFRNNQ